MYDTNESGEGSIETADVAPLSDIDGDGDTPPDWGPCLIGFSADSW
jgi:hypothetical protein